MVNCLVCGKPIGDEKFCSNCGSAIHKERKVDNDLSDINNTKYCTNCGELVEENDQFCSYCGNQINGDNFSGNKMENCENIDKTINDAEIGSKDILKEAIPNTKRSLKHLDWKDLVGGPVYTSLRKYNRGKNKQCVYCGTPYEDESDYCMECGNNLKIQRKQMGE